MTIPAAAPPHAPSRAATVHAPTPYPAAIARIAVIGNGTKPGTASALAAIRTWAGRHAATVETNLDDGRGPDGAIPGPAVSHDSPFGHEPPSSLRDRFAGADLAITLGGDGTLLFAVRSVVAHGTPVLSVNLGHVGFHTQAAPEELSAALDAIAAGRHRIERRMLLDVRLANPRPAGAPDAGAPTPGTGTGAQTPPPPCGDAGSLALNDVVVAKNAWGHMVHLRVEADGVPLTDVDADGLVAATPTGSSGYNYAAGGPVVVPWMDALVLNAICPHRTQWAPLVMSPGTTLTVKARRRAGGGDAQVLVDGQPWCSLAPDGELKISRSDLYLQLIVLHDDFYRKLRERLRWGGLS